MIQLRLAIFQAFFIGSIIVFLLGNFFTFPGMLQEAAKTEPSTRDKRGPKEQTFPPPDHFSTGGNCFINPHFPPNIQEWCSSISSQALLLGIDPNLIAAVILVESGGNPYAVSTSGAIGLMQVMPSDGPAGEFMCINGPCFADRPTSTKLFDPAFNISYGAALLSGLVQKYGDIRIALAAYGPLDGGDFYPNLVLNTMEENTR